MTKAQLLEDSTYIEIMIAFLEPSKIDEVSWHVVAFYETHRDIPNAIKNGVLMRAIAATNASGNTFSKPYLDSVLQTFKQYKINSTQLVIKFLDNKHNYTSKTKRKKEFEVPDYMDEFKALLEAN